jgi:putative endonuclease
MGKDSHIQTGKRAELEACKYLEKEGLQLKKRNYSCATGEIDLIMLHNDTLVFIEVRFRNNEYYGNGAETVDFRKQKKIISTALYFLKQNRHTNKNCRFDVISVTTSNHKYDIEWIQDAFQA